MKKSFNKSFTQQEQLPEASIAAAITVMRSGRLHRYNVQDGELGEAALLESEFSVWQGSRYCLATSSGGASLQIALRATGVTTGTKVLTNAFTLAPVPGAIHAVGAKPILVDSTDDLVIDLNDLETAILRTSAKFMMISHMRGHQVDMEKLLKLLSKHQVLLIEDCAHTMGASWNNTRSGNFGTVSCFSTQTYKHLNSGEGGLITTNSEAIIARAIILSGSYMLYHKHILSPEEKFFDTIKFENPNCSARMDNLRASILRPQLRKLNKSIIKWNRRYNLLRDKLSQCDGIYIPARSLKEKFVGSSFQFLVPKEWSGNRCKSFVQSCFTRGVELKWFGDLEPLGYTSRHESWKYMTQQNVQNTNNMLLRLFDMRIPLTFELYDMTIISEIIVEEYRLNNIS